MPTFTISAVLVVDIFPFVAILVGRFLLVDAYLTIVGTALLKMNIFENLIASQFNL